MFSKDKWYLNNSYSAFMNTNNQKAGDAQPLLNLEIFSLTFDLTYI